MMKKMGPAACNVLDFGAVGDGITLDTSAINRALGDRSCSSVLLPKNRTFLSGSLHLRSHLTLLVHGALLGAPAGPGLRNYDPPEPNPWSEWQDLGHSCWHPSLLWGEDLVDVTLAGCGVIDGGGGLVTGEPPLDGSAGDKLISLKSCAHVRIEGLTMRRTGHFALLATNVSDLTLSDLRVRPDRDGFDLVSVRNVRAERLDIAGGGDDAFVLKSDFSLGRVLPVSNVTLRDSTVSTVGATAVEIGSETVGDSNAIFVDNVTIASAGDAALGIASMDGARVSDVRFSNIFARNVTSPLQFTIGSRLLRPPHSCGGAPCVPGRIHDVSVVNFTGFDHVGLAHGGRNWTATIDGMDRQPEHNASRPQPVGPNVLLENWSLVYPGGGLASAVRSDPPHPFDHWYKLDGVRPAWGWYLRRLEGLVMRNVTLAFERDDGRPAMVLEDVADVRLSGLRAERAKGIAYDVGLRGRCERVSVEGSPGIVERRV
jgi:hypothetical protein